MIDSDFEKFWKEGYNLWPYYEEGMGPIPVISKLIADHEKKTGVVWADKSMTSRKEKILVVPIPDVLALMMGKCTVKLPPEIPTDSLPVRSFQQDATHCIAIVLHHPSFDQIPAGTMIPSFNLVVEYPQPAEEPQDEVPEVPHDSHGSDDREI